MKQRIGYVFLVVSAAVLIVRLFLIGNVINSASFDKKNASIHRSHLVHSVSLFISSTSSPEDQDNDDFINPSFSISSIFSFYPSLFSVSSLRISITYLSRSRVPFYILIHAFRI